MESPQPLRRTCLAELHESSGARMLEFGGWWMPVSYTSISEEHLRTRSAASLFDVSHMGRIRIGGPEAREAVERLCPLRMATLAEGGARYSFLLSPEGTTLDDLLVVHRAADELLLVVNAANTPQDLRWILEVTAPLEVQVTDETADTAMIAVQGPVACEIVAALATPDPSALAYYEAAPARMLGEPALVSRTGYTGEDGFEIIVDAGLGPALWQALLDASGGRAGAAGLGARDTLRLEAAMPLYGHELTRDTTPFDAGLSRFVDLENTRFVGHAALSAAQEKGRSRKLLCLRGEGRRIPRQGCPVRGAAGDVGVVTSGTFSPTFQLPIAMAYVEPSVKRGETLTIDVRGHAVPAQVVRRPFYRRG